MWENPDGDGQPFVARIEAMLQYPGESPVVRVKWMYRACDTGMLHIYFDLNRRRRGEEGRRRGRRRSCLNAIKQVRASVLG